MAAIGVLKAPHRTASVPGERAILRSKPLRWLSLAGGKISPKLDSPRRRSATFSPKAVSDSQNSQTCLDPDASRVCSSSS